LLVTCICDDVCQFYIIKIGVCAKPKIGADSVFEKPNRRKISDGFPIHDAIQITSDKSNSLAFSVRIKHVLKHD